METYDRQGRPMSDAEFLEKFSDRKYKRVAKTELPGGVRVSTVWLGVDHNWTEGPPLIFETMIFSGPLNESCWRYSTKQEALEGHRAAVALAKVAK